MAGGVVVAVVKSTTTATTERTCRTQQLLTATLAVALCPGESSKRLPSTNRCPAGHAVGGIRVVPGEGWWVTVVAYSIAGQKRSLRSPACRSGRGCSRWLESAAVFSGGSSGPHQCVG